MVKAKARPEAEDKDYAVTPSPGAHDAPGLSPFERMTELTRRVVNVPPKELAKERRKDEKGRGH